MTNTFEDFMKDEDDIEEKEKESEEVVSIIPTHDDENIKSLALIGDITEDTSRELICALLYLKDIEPKEEDAEKKPIQIYISTNGGNADDMFAAYDIMKLTQKEVDIETIGIGKVMSAGVLLLAAGTKGQRKIGRHCRVMLHSIIGGHIGPMHTLYNEMDAVKSIQKEYVKALSEETSLSVQEIDRFLKKKVNFYFDAETAIKYGIADEIL
jgi:ATP-dependent Clp protease protease subunit